MLSLSVFSSSVKAAEDNPNLIVDHYHNYNGEKIGWLTFTPNNNEIEKSETAKNYNTLPNGNWENRLQVRNKDSDILGYKDRKLSITVNNFYYSMLITTSHYEGDGVVAEMSYLKQPDAIGVFVQYADGTTKSAPSDSVSFYMRKEKIVNMVLSFTPTKDVEAVIFVLSTNVKNHAPTPNNVFNYNLTFYSGEYDGDDKYQISVNMASEELGLIEKILKTVTDVKDGIVELPQKIGNFIIEGIKSLFIPSDEFIVQFKEDINELLGRKLGAIYQVVDILANTWDSIEDSTVSQSVQFPKVSINLPYDNKFEFGGFDVKVVPDGFDFIVDSVKLITGVISTLLFVNGLKKRYDEVMGG